MKTNPSPRSQPPSQGFTLIELLVVIAIIGVLSSLLLPTLDRSKQKAQGIRCLSNLRQMGLAYQMYTDDNQDRLPLNYFSVYQDTWVRGWLDNTSSPDNTNTQYLEESLLGPYLKSLGVWKCPADRSTARILGRDHPRVRTVSMNGWLNATNEDHWPTPTGPVYRVPKKLSDLIAPAPEKTLVFTDEREDSINDSCFAVRMDGPELIANYPASYHNGAGTFSFADGHVERKKWLDRRTNPKLNRGKLLELFVPSPGNVDVTWIRERTTGLK